MAGTNDHTDAAMELFVLQTSIKLAEELRNRMDERDRITQAQLSSMEKRMDDREKTVSERLRAAEKSMSDTLAEAKGRRDTWKIVTAIISAAVSAVVVIIGHYWK